MAKKLYEVGVTAGYTLCVYAEDIGEAQQLALENYDAVDPEVYADDATVLTNVARIPAGWKDEAPISYDADMYEDLTCAQIILRTEEEEAARLAEERAEAQRLSFDFGEEEGRKI